MKKLIWSQFIILLASVIFAWSNFTYELYRWLNNKACELGCSANPSINPFLTPCFYGALFFTIAFILSVIILKKSKKNEQH